ncbi:MAG: divergent polysaccharide deacetylase family protein [Proteobacteria bacterium]|nr:divergent polysaccharide deacetylase family protein [Pseudomonadota bacterium]
MTSNDLSRPLGLEPNARTDSAAHPRLPLAPIVLGSLGLAATGFIGWLIWKSDPYGGEPHALVPIDRTVQTAMAKSPADPAKAAAPTTDPSRETAAEIEEASGVRVMRGKGGSVPGALIIKVPDAPTMAGRVTAVDRRLLERGRHGLLPKAADGLRPREVYARPFDAAAAKGKPMIAVMITGLGIAQGSTGEAIGKLPPDVSLAFAPYGTELEKQTQRAREDGHEVLLQVPMEPFDYPANDPGPQTLLAEAPETNTMDRLHWLMSRFQGYVGLTNFMGARFTASQKALKPVLDEASKRGLLVVDDGSSARSQMVAAAASAGVPAARGSTVLDSIDKATDLDTALTRAEASARSNGQALVVAPALPLPLERIGRWLRSLDQKGIVLVPVSALASGRRE